MWSLPRSGVEPVSPASVGGFLSTLPPRSRRRTFLKNQANSCWILWPDVGHLGSQTYKALFPALDNTECIQFSSVQLLSRVRLFVTPWTAARQASLSIANSGSLLKLMSIEWVMPSNYLILCHPLFLLPSIFPSIRVFSNESVLCIKWPKDWSSSFSISPSNEYSGIISFRMNWFDLLAVQGTPKSLPQHHSSKASVLQCSAFFVVWLSYPYMIIGKTMSYMKLFLPASIKTSLGSWTVFQHSKCSVNDGFQANEPRNIPDPCS